MVSARRLWAVSLYEFKWDLRKKRLFFAIGVVVLILVAVGALFRTVFGSNYGNVSSDLWDVLIEVVSNDFLSGIFPLMLGLMVAGESIAWEFDRETIVPLLSRPVSRGEVYMGKFLEKILFVIGISALFTGLAIIIAEVVAGSQSYLAWSPVVALSFALEVMVFVSLGFFLGTIIRTPGFLVVFIIIIFFGLLFGGVYVESQVGVPLWVALIPLFNINLIQGPLNAFYHNPSSNITTSYNVGGITGQSVVPVAPLLGYAVSGVLLTVIVLTIAGYLIFRRSEVKG